MESFDKFFKSAGNKKRGTRQQRGFTGMDRASQNLVPDCHKVDPTLNRKIEALRKLNTGTTPLSPVDLRYISTKYNITDLSAQTTEDSAKELGTTGIKIFFDPALKNYVIKK